MLNPLWKKTRLSGIWKLYIMPHCEFRKLDAEIASEADLIEAGLTPIEGHVPGNFELDMTHAGLLPDLLFGMNTLKAQELENRHLFYVRRFSWDGGREAELYFEGIDTVADIYLNGEWLGYADNMFVEHAFQAGNLIRGENELLVHITPAMIEARERSAEPYSVPAQAYNYASLTVRKAAHMYGWDIFPRIVSGGIWKDVYIFEPKEDAIREIYLYTTALSSPKAQMMCYYSVGVSGDFIQEYSLRVTGRHGDSFFTFSPRLWHTEGTVRFDVNDPHMWWPRDMGEQALYDVKVELLHGNDVVDTYNTILGIRTVRLDYSEVIEDNGDARFCFYVNDRPVSIRGTNWVPLSAFHSQDPEKLPQALSLLDEIGCNAIRIWGGGVYESDELYDWCDRCGVLIWQDFMMGCAAYPQTEEMQQALFNEARLVIARLRRHPSLALWAGDNECDQALTAWTTLRRDPSGNVLTRKVLPEAVRRFDPVRQFLPSSPYVSGRAFNESKPTPEAHLWGPRDYYKGPFYTKAKALFASETGYHGCPNPSSVRRFISPDKLFPWQHNEEWLVHAACMEPREGATYSYRIPLMSKQIDVLFGSQPEDLPTYAAASQISQAEAFKFFIERFRGAKWTRTGIIWWNLVDGWPQFSDAVVDWYGGKKLAFHVIKNSQNPVLLMFGESEKGAHPLILVNDTCKDAEVTYKVTDVDTFEVILEGNAFAPANCESTVIASAPDPQSAHCWRIDYAVGGVPAMNHYLTGKPAYDLANVIGWMKKLGYTFEEV